MGIKILLVVAGLSLVGWAITMVLLSGLARRPENLGLHDGRLANCPPTPNCVCSAADDDHAIEPLVFSDTPEQAWQRLKDVLANHPRTRVVREEGLYLHAECTSFLFRFVDDVEFLLDRDNQRIEVRSASRAGRSDLGVNRARVEAIRQAFAK